MKHYVFFSITIVSEVERELGSWSWIDVPEGALQNLNESSKPDNREQLIWHSPRISNNQQNIYSLRKEPQTNKGMIFFTVFENYSEVVGVFPPEHLP